MTKKQLNKENSCMRKALEKILYVLYGKEKFLKRYNIKDINYYAAFTGYCTVIVTQALGVDYENYLTERSETYDNKN